MASKHACPVGISTCASRGGKYVGKRACATLPGQKTVGISTCANRRARICRKIDLCKPFSFTSRIFDRIFPPMPPAALRLGKKLSECRPVQTFQLHKSHFRQDFTSRPSRRLDHRAGRDPVWRLHCVRRTCDINNSGHEDSAILQNRSWRALCHKLCNLTCPLSILYSGHVIFRHLCH